MADNIQPSYLGMYLDPVDSQYPEGSLSYALNALTEGHDGKGTTYQNEASNQFVLSLGFSIIGSKVLLEEGKTIYWVVNPSTGESQIGYVEIGKNTYHTIIHDQNTTDKLNFSVDRPIHKVQVRTSNCGTELYWADPIRRYLNLDDLPWEEVPDPQNPAKRIKVVGSLDINKMSVEARYPTPVARGIEEVVGGSLRMGAYQFIVQYANALGEGLSRYHNASSSFSIYEYFPSPNYDNPTTKAIRVRVDNLDPTGLYEHFNLAVVKTLNDGTTVHLVGTYPINGDNYEVIFTGDEQLIELSITEVFERQNYYDEADSPYETDGVLGWYKLKKTDPVSYQHIWSQVKIYWETHRVRKDTYKKGENTASITGYMRDEVYAIHGCLVLDSGEETHLGTIFGREPTQQDLEFIPVDNLDAQTSIDKCEEPERKRRWEVYNTASIIGYSREYIGNEDNDCYEGPYQYGEFAYWESERTLPLNTDIYGPRAGQKIRHPKFPDSRVTHIHDQGGEYIFPVGIKIDINSLVAAIQTSSIPESIKRRIVAFKIFHGNRAVHKSIIAKGLLYNVGEYQEPDSDEKVLYANYPFNDLRADSFYSTERLDDHVGYQPDKRINGFGEDSKRRLVFHSPDTCFYQPTLSQSSVLKAETVEYGTSKGHFVKVLDNAEYKFLIQKATYIGFSAGFAASIGVSISPSPLGTDISFNPTNFIPAFSNMLELLEKLIPYANFGYSFNSSGRYTSYFPIENAGYKNRQANFVKRIEDGRDNVGTDNRSINHFRRESCVYIGLDNKLPFPHEYDSSVPVDNSRYTLSSYGDNKSPETIRETQVSSIYASLKRYLPAQWGDVYSYEVVDTGYFQTFKDIDFSKGVPTVFGGDTFINRFSLKRKVPFFRTNTIGADNQADVEYDNMGNYGYPMFWLSTRPQNPALNVDTELNDFPTITGGVLDFAIKAPVVLGASIRLLVAVFTELYKNFGVKNTNLDRYSTKGIYEQGLHYLFAYGQSTFFVESGVNVDMRHATNKLEGDFYPEVGGEIPDDWYQEVEVPIIRDNTYNYNRTYSKQIKETPTYSLRDDWDPTKLCQTEFPNRTIWSPKTSQEDTRNNWLVYKPASYYDFPKSMGSLTSIDKTENRQTLVRFTNGAQLYNAFSTIPTSTGEAVLGSDRLFSATPPLDILPGSGIGSQHKLLISTPFGSVFVDAQRGKVVLVQGQKADVISSKGCEKWFSNNLPFQILKDIPDLSIDNAFKDIGVTGVYDALYQRLIITKRDFISLSPIDRSKDTDQYDFHNEKLFCDVSWTLSYSFKSNTWTSFHSYIPNFYNSYPTHFQSSKNSTIWNHNTQVQSYGSFYNQGSIYALENPVAFGLKDEILKNISEYCTSLKYDEDGYSYEPDEIVYFDKAEIWNRQQHSGPLHLIPRPKNKLSTYLTYPKVLPTHTEILVSKSDNLCNFNTFWDRLLDKNKPMFVQDCSPIEGLREFNIDNLDPSTRTFAKAPFRAKDLRVRRTLTKSDVRLISNFILTPTQTSYK